MASLACKVDGSVGGKSTLVFLLQRGWVLGFDTRFKRYRIYQGGIYNYLGSVKGVRRSLIEWLQARHSLTELAPSRSAIKTFDVAFVFPNLNQNEFDLLKTMMTHRDGSVVGATWVELAEDAGFSSAKKASRVAKRLQKLGYIQLEKRKPTTLTKKCLGDSSWSLVFGQTTTPSQPFASAHAATVG